MYTFDFALNEMPDGLINLQISSDENVIFTFSNANIVDIIRWATRNGLSLGEEIEMHINFKKECIDVVIPLIFFEI